MPSMRAKSNTRLSRLNEERLHVPQTPKQMIEQLQKITYYKFGTFSFSSEDLEAIQWAVSQLPMMAELQKKSEEMQKLISNAARNMITEKPRGVDNWVAIRDGFLIGSTSAAKLCQELGIDPDNK